MNTSRRRQAWPWLVLLMAIGAVLGHVFPAHAHTDELAAAPAEASAPDAHGDDAVYRGTCEALRTPAAPLVPSPVPVSTVVLRPLAAREGLHGAPAVFRPDSPPLFLLHAAFLI